jgi:hypothetical protein
MCLCLWLSNDVFAFRVSREVWDEWVRVYDGGPSLSDKDLCDLCCQRYFAEMSQDSKLKSFQEVICSLLSEKLDRNETGFWVSTTWLKVCGTFTILSFFEAFLLFFY